MDWPVSYQEKKKKISKDLFFFLQDLDRPTIIVLWIFTKIDWVGPYLGDCIGPNDNSYRILDPVIQAGPRCNDRIHHGFLTWKLGGNHNGSCHIWDRSNVSGVKILSTQSDLFIKRIKNLHINLTCLLNR